MERMCDFVLSNIRSWRFVPLFYRTPLGITPYQILHQTFLRVRFHGLVFCTSTLGMMHIPVRGLAVGCACDEDRTCHGKCHVAIFG